MGYVEENIRWDLEFDKVKDKDDLGLIMEDAWVLTDDTLVSRVQNLFDFRTPLGDELNELVSEVGFGDDLRRNRVCRDVKGLKRKLCEKDEKEEDRGGECLRRKRVCGDNGVEKISNDVKVLSYAEKLEKAKRKLRDGYDSYSRNRKTSQIISLKEIGSKGKLKKTIMKGKLSNKGLTGQRCSNQNRVGQDGARDAMTIDENKKLNDVFKFSYAERVEMAKAKLQQGYDRCASERKKTCVISLNDIPKPPCGNRVAGFKPRHCLSVSGTIRGY